MRALRTCLFWLALFVAIAWAIAMIVERRLVPREQAIAAGLFGALFTILGVAWLLQIVTRLRALTLVRRGLGGEEPVDGEMYAACGPIEAVGLDPLVTPITRTPAVAYNYRIATLRDRRVWEGVALGPSRIQCGVYSVRILALPQLDIPYELCTEPDAKRNAEAWLHETTFSGERGRFFGATKLPDPIYSDENGAVRWDIGDGRAASLGAAMLHERVIRPGDEVCAIGRYSGARGGLALDPRARRHSIVLRKGKPESSASAVFGSIGNIVKATIALGIVAVGLAALQTFVPLHLVEIAQPAMRPSWLEVRIDDLLEVSFRGELERAGLMSRASVRPDHGLALGAAQGRVRSAKGEASVASAETRRVEDTLDILLFDERGSAVAAFKISSRGELLRARILGEEIDFRAVPVATYAFDASEGTEIGGRVSWYAPDVPSARVRFRAPLPGAE